MRTWCVFKPCNFRSVFSMVSSCTWGFCHFAFLPVLSLAWELWEQWAEQKSNCSHALLSVGISLLTLLTTILPRFIYSCGDAAQCKIGQCFSTLGQMCILSLGRWCCVQQGCAQELLQELWLEVGWSHPVHLPELQLSQTGVCCAAVSSCCTHTLFHIWKCLSWRSEKPFPAPGSAGV